MTRAREAWTSRLGVILAVSGSAVGLGNFLRFPGVAVHNGGGAFMIPYLVCFLLIGLPMTWVEWSLGRAAGRRGFSSAPAMFRAAVGNRTWGAYVGALAAMVPLGIYMYYVLLEAWCLAFAWQYWSGGMAQVVEQAAQAAPHEVGAGQAAAQNYIWQLSGLTGGDGSVFAAGLGGALPFILVCFLLNFVLIARGVSKGIEWFCRWAMPLLGLCAIVVLLRVLTLPPQSLADGSTVTVLDGLGYMWNPVGHQVVDGRLVEVDMWTVLGNPQTWLAAAGQIFFTLSVGMGVLSTYASYLKKDDDIALSALSASAGNGFCEVCLGGCIVIPATILFVAPVDVVGQGSLSLGFAVLPAVFEHMPAGHVFGGLFFFLLFLAAVTSSLSMLQPAIALLEEGLGLARRASVALLSGLTACGAGLITWLSGDLLALDHADFWLGNFALLVIGLFEVVVFAWVFGTQRGLAELRRGSDIRIPDWVGFLLRYVTPLVLALVFGLWLADQIATGSRFQAVVENPSVSLTVGFLLLTLTLFVVVVARSLQRWKQADQASAAEGA